MEWKWAFQIIFVICWHMTALKIHVSMATYEELKRTMEYILEKRGQVDVKVCIYPLTFLFIIYSFLIDSI